MQEVVSVDVAIIGGGIVGLTLAYELKNKFPDCEIAIFDKEPYVGEHSSGRNSGVLHAGIYYPHGSLKHLLCLEGNKLWNKLCSDLKITSRPCGKLIFATNEKEESKLSALFEAAKKNDVPIQEPSNSQLTELKKHVNAIKAISSPSTGIIDVSEALSHLRYNLESRGVNVFYSHVVKQIELKSDGVYLELNDFVLKSQKVVNCAGLGAISIREKLGLKDLENYFVRGNYLSTSQKLDFKTLYYPIPPDDLKGLGVHSTIDPNGKVKFGPNTEEVEKVDYSPTNASLDGMKDLVSFYFKEVRKEELFWDYTGCRSKIRFKADKKIHTDFWIESPLKNYIECLGIESPGLTSAPAIARFLVNKYLS